MTCPRSHGRQVAEQTFLCRLPHPCTKVPCFPAGIGSGVKEHRWSRECGFVCWGTLEGSPALLGLRLSQVYTMISELYNPALTWVVG